MQQSVTLPISSQPSITMSIPQATKLPDIELDWHFYPPSQEQINEYPTMHMLTMMGIAVYGVWPSFDDYLNDSNDQTSAFANEHFVAWTTNAQIIADHSAKHNS